MSGAQPEENGSALAMPPPIGQVSVRFTAAVAATIASAVAPTFAATFTPAAVAAAVAAATVAAAFASGPKPATIQSLHRPRF